MLRENMKRMWVGVGVAVVAALAVLTLWWGRAVSRPTESPVVSDSASRPEKLGVPASEKAGHQPGVALPQVLETLQGSNDQDFAVQMERWATEAGDDRDACWDAVRGGAKQGKSPQTRMRACLLAEMLAEKGPGHVPEPIADGVAASLLTCLLADDQKISDHGLRALTAVHARNPAMRLKEKMCPPVEQMLRSNSLPRLRVAVKAARFLQDPGLASPVASAWYSHHHDRLFADTCRRCLRLMLERHLGSKIETHHPEWSRAQRASEAIRQADDMNQQFGLNAAEWKCYWEKERPSSR